MLRPAFSFCLCPDSQLLRNRLDTLLAAYPPAGGGAWKRFVFWGDEGIVSAFWEHLTLQGLFAEPKALVIRNAHTVVADTLKRLSNALTPLAGQRAGQLPSPLIWPFICIETPFERGKPKVPSHIQRLDAYKMAEEHAWLDCTPGLTPQSMPAYIKAEASSRGLRLTPTEVALFSGALPPDAALISSEISKIALSADASGRLPEGDGLLPSQTQELGIFELMRLVQQNNQAPKAWRQILESRLSGENMVFGFISLLLREARLLWQSLAGGPVNLPPQIALQKKIAADSLGFSGIARLWDLALAADKGIKSGERSPEQAFEILAGELFVLFRRRHR